MTPRCPFCGDTGTVTINTSRGLGPEWDRDVRCGCSDDDDDSLVPFDMDDDHAPEGPSRPGDPDWEDPWD